VEVLFALVEVDSEDGWDVKRARWVKDDRAVMAERCLKKALGERASYREGLQSAAGGRVPRTAFLRLVVEEGACPGRDQFVAALGGLLSRVRHPGEDGLELQTSEREDGTGFHLALETTQTLVGDLREQLRAGHPAEGTRSDSAPAALGPSWCEEEATFAELLGRLKARIEQGKRKKAKGRAGGWASDEFANAARTNSPERQLAASALLRAVADSTRVDQDDEGSVPAAAEWLFGGDPGEMPPAFVYVATALGVDADAIRGRVKVYITYQDLTNRLKPRHDRPMPSPKVEKRKQDERVSEDLSGALPRTDVDLIVAAQLLVAKYQNAEPSQKEYILTHQIEPALEALIDVVRQTAEGKAISPAKEATRVLGRAVTRASTPSERLLTVLMAADILGLADRVVKRFCQRDELGALFYDAYRIAHAALEEFQAMERPPGVHRRQTRS
jgi:hypothetical protein